MIAPRWRKVLKDLVANKARTVLVMLTIAVGVFAVGFVSSSFTMIITDMNADYQSVNPHASIIYTEPFDEDFLSSLHSIPGVGFMEGRSEANGKYIAPNGKTYPVLFTATPALDQIQIDRIRPSRSQTQPLPVLGKGDVYIEQSALTGLQITPGEVLQVELPDGRTRDLVVAGIVHDVASFPFVFTQQVAAYTSLETLEWLGGADQFSEIYLTVSERKTDEAFVKEVAAAVADKIEQSGREVFFTFVYQPGRHFASDITSALGIMTGMLGVMSVLLSAFLIVNTLNALLGQHIRQIGVMKSIGANTRQLVGMYLALVLCFGLLSLIVAVPLAALAAHQTAQGIAVYLNFRPSEFHIPGSALILQIFVALIVPVFAALLPVVRGTRITIREAITSYGLGRGKFGKNWIDLLVESIRGLPRPLLVSLRNTFRRKARLLLTLSTLSLAGGIFIGVFNLRAGMNHAIDQTLGYILSDVNISFNQPYRMQKIEPLALQVAGVERVEGWGSAIGEMLTHDEAASTQILFLAPPSDSVLINPTLTSGRWLDQDDENAIVIGNHLLEVRPELQVGDEVSVSIDGKETKWHIVGTYRMAGNVVPPIVYANYEYLASVQGGGNPVGEIRVRTGDHSLLAQERVGQALQTIFASAGVNVNNIQYGADITAQNNAQTDILVLNLVIMAGLIGLVGGLGLMSTMSMNVIERTREIGVLRAIGASNGSVMQIIIVEGMIIGSISWIIGFILAFPIGSILNYFVGVAFLRSPLDLIFAMDGFTVWLVIVLILSAIASFLPARSASRLTVREVLAYE